MKYMNYILDTMKKLLAIPSPSGFTREAAEFIIAELEAMGHPTYGYDDWNRIMGSVNSCMILPDGTFQGVADPRRDGLAVGL